MQKRLWKTTETVHAFLSRRIWKNRLGVMNIICLMRPKKNLSLPLEISFAVMLMRPAELFRTLCANLMRHEQTLHLD